VKIMGAPINVLVRDPDPAEAGKNWPEEASKWVVLNREAGGNTDFFPLTIKVAYIIGVIHDICESVSCLLGHPRVRETTYIPAYGVFASGVELLGRCINGNPGPSGSTEDLKTGFKWLESSSYQDVSENQVLIKTSSNAYTISMLTALRHFAAHGQAALSQFDNIDYEILNEMPALIACGLERYFDGLLHSILLCNKLARARVTAFRDWPVLKSWLLLERDESGIYHSITEIFKRFNWRI
jgi:hypothetical protein